MKESGSASPNSQTLPTPLPPAPSPSLDQPASVSGSFPENDRNREREPRRAPNLADYQLVKPLGEGSYAKVFLARKRSNNLACALKIMPRRTPEKHSHGHSSVVHFSREVDILTSIINPFVIQIQSAFANQNFLFMELELATGGTLQDLFQNSTPRIPVSTIKFYMAQLILALHYLHEDGIIFRDLKPANIMIDSKGYIKIIDFGLAKKLEEDRCSTPCGTFLYRAPETFSKKHYGFTADWWSLGVTFYWMLSKRFPFYIPKVNAPRPPPEHSIWKHLVRQKIIAGSYEIPPGIPHECETLLRRLLSNDPKRRQLDAHKLANFEWFSDFNWEELQLQKCISPYIPEPMSLPWDPEQPESNSQEKPCLEDFSVEYADPGDTVE